ncbi:MULTISPECIES: ABC transporter ATP-binding protein [unclassified Roseitalea]|uniref:ABC transporter ATP-binding protein n=1 Tax=unclassified Roseitalea TaxID=2639107 RepID=UPI00273CF7EB|nr:MULTISPECIES: ABC transporter ATP-binding protein [unclassified Roseitalea]
MSAPLLEVDDLSVAFGAPGGDLFAVEGVSFAVEPGEIVALVGESGSGKSATSMALARLNEGPGAAIGGSIRLNGEDVLAMDAARLRQLRGKGIAMVFQDAMTALNPCETIGDQIAESLVVHGTANWRAARARAVALLDEVGMPEPQRRAGLYPHEVSGGQRQRAMIALALACDPHLLIADEPTTALDVTIQAQILALLSHMVRRRGMAMILITHDLGVVAGVADRVMVIYAGRIVEMATVEALFAAPRHPYTRDLIKAAGMERDAGGHLAAIAGAPPRIDRKGDGCAYAPRCANAIEKCHARRPELASVGRSLAACWHPVPDSDGAP